MAKKPIIDLPSNFSLRRSIDVSEAEMFSVIDGKLIPVEVRTMTVRGAIGTYSAGYDKKGNTLTDDVLAKQVNPTRPNIQRIDLASLDAGSDTLAVRFAVAFHGASREPDSCNSAEFSGKLNRFIELATKQGAYHALAERYAWTLLSARWLWRNGCGVDKIVTVTPPGNGKKWIVNSDVIAHRSFPSIDTLKKGAAENSTPIDELVDLIEAGLNGTAKMTRLAVEGRVTLYPGAEVWPSQEFAEGRQKTRNGEEISRVLSAKPAQSAGRDIQQGTIHPQKIGNAIRTIDEWHNDPNYGAIAIEVFGWVQRDQTAIRKPGKNDFYTAMKGIDDLILELEGGKVSGTTLYMLACLIRGGVFPMKEDKADAA